MSGFSDKDLAQFITLSATLGPAVLDQEFGMDWWAITVLVKELLAAREVVKAASAARSLPLSIEDGERIKKALDAYDSSRLK